MCTYRYVDVPRGFDQTLVVRLLDVRPREAVRRRQVGAQRAFFSRDKNRTRASGLLVDILITNVQTGCGRFVLQDFGILVPADTAHVSGNIWFLQEPL